MKIEYLNDFLVFSQTLNYSYAARKLYTTQPSLSNHVRALEKEFGVRLVTQGQNPELTPAGKELVERGSELMGQYDAMVQAIRNAGKIGEEITILENNAPMGALSNLSQVNLSFLLRNPNVSVTTAECTDHSVFSALANRRADAAACFDCPLEEDVRQGIKFVELPDYAHARLALWMSKNHPLTAVEHLTWEAIAEHGELKHPLPNHVCRLWANTTEEIMAKHGVTLIERRIAEISAKFFLQIREDEVQLFDSAFNTIPSEEVSGKILKPLEGEDSRSLLWLGYDPKRVTPAFRKYLDYIEFLRKEQVEEREIFG